MGQNHFAPLPTAIYGVDLFLAAIAYWILQTAIVKEHGPRSRIASALGGDRKAKLSLALYAAAVPLAFYNQWISDGIYVCNAMMWLIPDRRIESTLHRDRG